jgi:hypothetical protein
LNRNQEIYQAYIDDVREHSAPNWERISDAIPHIDLSVRQMRRIARAMYKEDEEQAAQEEFQSFGDANPEEEYVNFEINRRGDGATASSNSKKIKTLEALLEACKADMSVWRVKHHIVNVFEMGRKHKIVDISWKDGRAEGFVKDTGDWNQIQNWQVKAWFEPRREYPIDKAIDDIIARIDNYKPDYSKIKPLEISGDYLFVPSIYDAHINKLSYDGGYTLKQAVKDFKAACSAMVSRAIVMQMPIKKILFVVGQDALHADNLAGQTTHGTWMDVADNQRRAVDGLCDALTFAIEQFAKIAPTEVIAIESNHDKYSVYWLGKFLSAWFKNHPHVTVDSSMGPRKYFRFGKVLLGLDHGDKQKPADLALTMAVESPENWAKTKYREFLRGHFHKQTSMLHQVNEEKGVVIRVLPALCPPDEWHVIRGFIGNHRAADGLFYHYEHGPAGNFPVFIDEL